LPRTRKQESANAKLEAMAMTYKQNRCEGTVKMVNRDAPSGTKTGLSKADAKPIRISPGKLLQVQGRLLQGESQRQIARELRVSRRTVVRVIKTENFVHHIKEMQERLFAIAPIAIESFRAQVATDGNLAYALLKDLQIIPTREALEQFVNATPAEPGFERQARMLASVLSEAHEHLGLDSLKDVVATLAKDSRECPEAKTSRPKLLRS
jgi:transcriptional regulator with XRE-family HTH domain